MGNLSIRLPEDLERRLAEEAERAHCGRSELVREAIQWYLTAREKRRFMSALVEDAQRLTRTETAGVADDWLAFDNEALEIGEPEAGYRASPRKGK